jgi:hypothetical protein
MLPDKLLMRHNLLFLVLGRTGYVALVIGLGMWLFFSQGRSQRGALLLFGTIAFPALLLIPNKATNRIIQGVGEIKICMAVSVANVNEACNSSIEGHLFMIFVAILAGYPVSDVQRVKNNYLTQ